MSVQVVSVGSVVIQSVALQTYEYGVDIFMHAFFGFDMPQVSIVVLSQAFVVFANIQSSVASSQQLFVPAISHRSVSAVHASHHCCAVSGWKVIDVVFVSVFINVLRGSSA